MLQMRAVSLTGYPEVARSVGLDGQRLLREAGISLEWLDEPENRLPATAVIRLLERSGELSGCEHFGLQMTEARTFASLGPLALLLERLATPLDVVREGISFQRHMNDVVTISMEDEGDTCIVRLDIAQGYWSVQASDHIVSMAFRVLKGASGGRWHPECVHLVRKEPADPAPWRRFFAAPIEFDATFNGLSSSREAMQVPNPLADETMARHARQLLRLVPLDSGESLSERVRWSITLLLPSGRATVDQVALQLGMSARSLQRRLEDEGCHFAELLQAVRQELALGYLTKSAHPVTAVAAMLGYASPSSFTRWFAKTFGVSPQAWRTARAANDDPHGSVPASAERS